MSHPLRPLAAALLLLAIPLTLDAQMIVGHWVRTPTKTAPLTMTMDVERCCGNGYKLTYHFTAGQKTTVMTVSSPFDGSEVPVLVDGKASGERMAIKRLDDHHASTTLTMNGEPFGTSQSTLSADGKTISVINDFSAAAGGNAAGKTTEAWTKQ